MKIRTPDSKDKNVIRIVIEILGLVFLFLFPFLHINSGVDLTDTGYGLSNFENFPNVNMTWSVSTFLSLLLGKLFTFLPGGHTCMGIYGYCMALSGIMVIIIYFLLKRYIPWYAVLIGEFVAVGFSWAPKTCIYQYMSYYLLDIGALLILESIRKEKKFLLFPAGFILALNSFIRFPNILDMGLILVVFLYGILKKKNILSHFVICFLSYISGFILCIIPVSIIYGSNSYIGMINGLFGMTKEASDYEPTGMISTIVHDYYFFSKWYLVLLAYAIIAFFVYGVLKNTRAKAVFLGLLIPAFCVVSIILYKLGAFNFWYYAYSSIYGWGVFLIISAIILCVYRCIKEKDIVKRLLAFTILLVILITPLGSNQGLYTSINNLFLIVPFLLSFALENVRELLTKKLSPADFLSNGKNTVPIRCVVFLTVMAALMQGTLFGMDFIFRDEPYLTGDFRTIEENRVLRNMRTGTTNAETLEEISRFAYDNGLNGKKAIFYGQIPLLSYCLEMPCAIGHTWPSLDSYTIEELKAELKEMDGLPYFIYRNDICDYFSADGDNITTEKEKLLMSFIRDNNYHEIFRNSRFSILAPGNI